MPPPPVSAASLALAQQLKNARRGRRSSTSLEKRASKRGRDPTEQKTVDDKSYREDKAFVRAKDRDIAMKKKHKLTTMPNVMGDGGTSSGSSKAVKRKAEEKENPQQQ